jgi:signal transduction histidine kinase
MMAAPRVAFSVDGVFRSSVPGYDRAMTWGRASAPLGFDLVFSGALLVFGVSVSTRADLANGTILDTLLLPAVVLPVLGSRRWPFAAAVGLFAGTVISGVPTFDQFRLGVAIPAAMVILFRLASRCERRRAVIGLGFVLAGMVFVGDTDAVLKGNGGLPAMILFSFPLCLASWGAGRAAFSRDRLAERLAEQSVLLGRQRERTAELAVEVERTRLATDLDLAARGRIRMMIELAARAEHAFAADPERVRGTFAQIERMGRESLNEMRDLLGVLRSDEYGSRAPRPTLAELDALLTDARAGGRLVDLEMHGQRRPLPLGIELATYRALQHALVAVSGAPGQPTTVKLSYLHDSLELEVAGVPSDDERAAAALAAARQRVVAQGGRFDTGGPYGGRVLRATFPAAIANA